MSFTATLAKIVIKMTPNKLIIWVANIVLKDIAELTGFNFDIETRSAYIQIQLVGESETIDVWLNGFGIISTEETYQFIIEKAESNRLWLANLLARFVGKKWKIPVPENLAPQFKFVAELLAKEPDQSLEN